MTSAILVQRSNLLSYPVFLPDRGIAALLHFFRQCRTKISQKGPKGAKKQTKKNALCNILYVSFLYKPSFYWLWH